MPFASTNSPDGSLMGFPDVCQTPMGPSVVPVPYPCDAVCSDADPATLAETVMICGFPAATVETVIMLCQGDEEGVLGGVISGGIMGPCGYELGSETVFMGGLPCVFQGSTTPMNGTPNANCPVGMQDSPSQEMVTVAP